MPMKQAQQYFRDMHDRLAAGSESLVQIEE